MVIFADSYLLCVCLFVINIDHSCVVLFAFLFINKFHECIHSLHQWININPLISYDTRNPTAITNADQVKKKPTTH